VSQGPSANPPFNGCRPLLATSDPQLLDEMLRLTAAAGVEPEVAPDLAMARRSWSAASLILLGADLLGERLTGLPRRDGVVLVALGRDEPALWQRAVEIGAEHVVFVPAGEQWLTGRITEAADGGGEQGAIVCVLGGRGGAGASTLAAALAVTAARRGRRCLLIDGDPLGGGIDLLLGGEQTTGLRWPDLAGARGRVSGTALHQALPHFDGLAVLSWDRGDALAIPVAAMDSVLGAARRGSDLVVVDLPRRVDEAAELALRFCGVGLLVVPAEVRATAAAARIAASAGLVVPDLRLVVRGPAPSGLPADAVAGALGLPLAGYLRAEPGLAAAQERGEPPTRGGRGPLAQFCDRFLDLVTAGARAAA
jgi:secretion/DNA translocation related CpaE-like protein